MPAEQHSSPPLRESVLLVVSGPSGSGKDSLVEALRRKEPGLDYSVSATTRRPRAGELDGVHYHFMAREAFEQMRSQGGFLETREYAGNLYGTPKAFIEDALHAGRDLIMKPEVNGAMAMKRLYPKAVLVFLTAPSENVLRERLERRSSETAATIEERIAIAQAESAAIRHYEYLIVNDDLETALGQLHAILVAERLKVARVRPSESPAGRR